MLLTGEVGRQHLSQTAARARKCCHSNQVMPALRQEKPASWRESIFPQTIQLKWLQNLMRLKTQEPLCGTNKKGVQFYTCTGLPQPHNGWPAVPLLSQPILCVEAVNSGEKNSWAGAPFSSSNGTLSNCVTHNKQFSVTPAEALVSVRLLFSTLYLFIP